MKYWKIMCARGHSGCGKQTEIVFAIKANTLLEAQAIARKMPSVKHTRGIMFGCEITEAEYNDRMKFSAYDRLEKGWGR